MDLKKNKHLPLKIAIVGAGFSGTALVAAFHRLSQQPVEIILIEKSGNFGAGDAYSTPFPFHLLNVRAQDMSALEDEPGHFVNWLDSSPTVAKQLNPSQAIGEQFVPRFLYGDYLKQLLHTIQSDSSSKISLTLKADQAVDILPSIDQATVVLKGQQTFCVDKVVLALGNNPPASFPFPVSSEMKCIHNPWDYLSPKQITKDESVLIVGTGLSMIDAVLTLKHQQHQGKIYAVSRHGLLPLSHADVKVPYLLMQEQLPSTIREMTRYLRSKSKKYMRDGGDWRSIINALRAYAPSLWQKTDLSDRKQFLRHVLPYWNIHRHRVHNQVAEMLAQLSASGQLTILGGRILEVDQQAAHIQLRRRHDVTRIETKWLINCMGPSFSIHAARNPLIHALLSRGMVSVDPLDLGFAVSTSLALQETPEKISSLLYTLGPPARGAAWECSAVPEIRKQCFNLVKHLLNIN